MAAHKSPLSKAERAAIQRNKPGAKERRDAYNFVYRRLPTAKAQKRARRLGVPLEEIPQTPADGRCQCCGKLTKIFHFDHDHELEALGFPILESFRGWTCHPCNSGIGMLGDNLEGARNAVVYLARAQQRK
jgi:hypothetical protein